MCLYLTKRHPFGWIESNIVIKIVLMLSSIELESVKNDAIWSNDNTKYLEQSVYIRLLVISYMLCSLLRGFTLFSHPLLLKKQNKEKTKE